MAKKKMIQVDEEEYNKLVAAQKKLMEEGKKKLPKEVGNGIGSFALGAMVGVGAAALTYLLSKEEGSEKKRGKK